MVKICLNMIVKNESMIIKEILLNISKYIDYWVISDTGSTDNTIEVIKNFFQESKISGKIFQDKWIDFGTNRTIALKHALNESKIYNLDYIFIMDADDLIEGELKWPEIMDADGYYLKFGVNFVYLRQQIFKSTLTWIYRGVLHEFPECVNKKPTNIKKIEGEYYINSRRLSSRNSDPEKYLKDALILEKAIEENKEPELLSRYLFYTGQSYYDYNNYEKSLYWYKKRVDCGGWIEEIYYSMFKIAECMIKLSYEKNEIIKTLLKGINIIKERPECYYILGDYLESLYNLENNHEKKNKFLNLSYFYFNLLNNLSYVPERDSTRLFLYKEIYNWLGKYKFGEISFKLEKYQEVKNICDEILEIPSNRTNVYIYEKVENLKNNALNKILIDKEKKITSYPTKIINKLIKKYKNLNLDNKEKKIILTMTTCKRLNLFIKTINSFINCCEDIDLIDDWLIIDDNSSLHDRDIMKYEYSFVNWIFKNGEQKGHANSMNIIREMTKNYEYVIYIEDDWLFFESTYYIKPALDILESNNYKLYENEDFLSNELENKKIVQVLFNKNYHETFNNIIWGGFLMETNTNLKTKFLLHEHRSSDKFRFKNKVNCAYWPHFSFKPSIFKREIFNILGPYDKEYFFERTYADKFYSSNYLSCFYDKITCLHIGKLTNSQEEINAYELNNQNQGISKLSKNKYDNKNFIFIHNLDSMSNDILFMKNRSINDYINISLSLDDCVCFNTYGYFKNKLESNLINLPDKFYKPDGLFINILKTHDEIICINLKRRPDRKELVEKLFIEQNLKYIFHEAVDGNELTPNEQLINLLKLNDFGSKKGVIGCALSHLNLWKELIVTLTKKYYIVVEDNIKLHFKFKEYLLQIQHKLLDLYNWDILFLGFHVYKNIHNLYNPNNLDDDLEIKIIDFDYQNYIGGTFGFIVSKTGAEKLIAYINSNGILHGIDYLIKIVPNLQIYQLEKFIIYSDWVYSNDSNVDTDIQKNYD
jgi:GR25 family glycosyltransferase involved in LPS biosynthesis